MATKIWRCGNSFLLLLIFSFCCNVSSRALFEDSEDFTESNELEEKSIESEEKIESKVVEVSKQGGSMSSPDYPRHYPSNVNYTWLFEAPPKGKIRILLTDLRIEATTKCLYDYLDIYDGGSIKDTRLAHLCGRAENLVFVSSGNKMLLLLKSDADFEEEGFHLEYVLEMGNKCNVTLTELDDVITSPNYPSNYPDNVDCWTLIKLPNEKDQVMASFTNVQMEFNDKCTFDYVKIYDGVSAQPSKLLGKFCDKYDDSPIISSSGNMLVHFHSDNLLNNHGFSLSYSAVGEFYQEINPEAEECGWKLDKFNGTITSPNYPKPYESDQQCLFFLSAPVGKKVLLTIDKIVMDGHEECKLDYLEVRDGHSKDANLLGKFCGRPIDVHQEVVSTGNEMWVKFVSDETAEFRGFEARYSVVKFAPVSKVKCKKCGPASDKVDAPIVITSTPQNISLTRGQSHMFTCLSDDPTIKPKWMKDMKVLGVGQHPVLQGLKLFANGSLLISSMEWNLQGVYTCTLVSESDIRVVNAWISYVDTKEEEHCPIRFSITPQSISEVEGNYAFLKCSTVNPSRISWRKDGKEIIPDENPNIRILLPGLLLLHPLTLAERGIYTCRAATTCQVKVNADVHVEPNPRTGCGISMVKVNRKKPHKEAGRIVSGQEAVHGSSPWQVMLTEDAIGAFCGGSVIHQQWILTAAHCFSHFQHKTGRHLNINKLKIKLGKKHRMQYDNTEQVMEVDKHIIHPNYTATTFDNDIALIRLKTPAQLTDYVLPICLANLPFLDAHVYSKQVFGVVSGWGEITRTGVPTNELREVVVPTVDHETCKKSVTTENSAVTKNMFCAGFAEAYKGDSCNGDSGGPFAVEINHKWYLAGIVSWGEECDAEDKYGFYTKVGNYYEWISNTIAN